MKDILSSIFWFKNKKLKEHKSILKNRLLRYFEEGQANVYGSFYQTREDILNSNICSKNEVNMVFEVIEELVAQGFLEYIDGAYYLKGCAPKY